MTRTTKFLSLILSLILVLVLVPMYVVSEEITDEQDNLSVTQPNDELVEQSSFEEITDVQSNLDVTISNDELIDQELTNEITSTTTSSYSQLVTGIPDGIYAIEIATLSSYYITYSTSSNYVSCNSIAVSPTLMGMPAYLFKITRVPDTDRYIIRSVADSTITLCVSGDYVVWGSISADDSQVLESNTFNIIGNNGALLIKEVGTGKYICGGGGSLLAATDSLETQVLTSWIFRGYRSYIEDGVYSFENVGNVGLWMDTQYDSYLPGKYAQQYAYESCPMEDFSRGGMFKISRIGDTDQYVIRLMTNNLLAWGIDGTAVLSQSVGIDDSQIPDNAKFHIAYDSGNYIIIPYGTMNVITATPNSTASGGGSTEARLSTVYRTNMQQSARWEMYIYSGTVQWGVGIDAPNEMSDTGAIVGQSYTVNPVVWITHFGSHNSRITLSTECNSNAVIFDWDTDNQQATVEIINPGYLSLSVDLFLESGGNVSTLCSEQYEYNAIPKVGTYYIRNSESEKYATIENYTYEEGIAVEQSEFSTGNYCKWDVEHVSGSGGYIRLKSVFSGKYLGVDPNNSSNIKQYASPGDNGLWRFELLDDYSVKIICKASESSGKVLAVPLLNPFDGADLTQREYTDNSNCSDEWIVSPNRYQFYIDHYYDIGYSVRFSEINPNVDELIESYQNYVSEFFATMFDVEIKFTCQQYTSPADICLISQYGSVNANNLISNCPHPHTDPNNTDPLHTTRTALKESLLTGDNTKSVVIWTGHILDGNPVSCAFNYTVVMTPYHTTKSYDNFTNKTSDQVYFYSIRSLIHELSHQLGAPDHYCRKDYDENGHCTNMNCDMCHKGYLDIRKCVMGDTDDFSVDHPDEIYCSECIETILSHLNDHH